MLQGCACDVGVDGQQAYEVHEASLLNSGFTGIGVNQKTSGRFIHLDTLEEPPRKNVWSY
jgi:zinc D-Ala-D-Ala carboxypeptidase